jgi:predicted nuclease of restriction endonuclease-like (RecB) superfamily
LVKSSYNLDFLGLRETFKEKDLEDRIIDHLQAFMLGLGYGYTFVGQ